MRFILILALFTKVISAHSQTGEYTLITISADSLENSTKVKSGIAVGLNAGANLITSEMKEHGRSIGGFNFEVDFILRSLVFKIQGGVFGINLIDSIQYDGKYWPNNNFINDIRGDFGIGYNFKVNNLFVIQPYLNASISTFSWFKGETEQMSQTILRPNIGAQIQYDFLKKNIWAATENNGVFGTNLNLAFTLDAQYSPNNFKHAFGLQGGNIFILGGVIMKVLSY
jgi:hypothetical protein